MTKLTSQQLKEIYMKLPKDLQDAIFSVDSSEAIQKIGKKYNLTVEKIGDLADETGLVMLGITSSRDYVDNLAKRLNVSHESALKIANEVSNLVFSKVRESLKKVHHEEESSPPTPLPQGEGTERGEASEVKKEDIMKEIEQEDDIPKIFQGMHSPAESSFEAKTKDDVFRMPLAVSESELTEESIHEEEGKKKEQEKKVENKYPSGDPYREPIE